MIGPITDAAWMDQAGRCLRAQQDGGSAGGPVATVSARVRKPWAAAGLSRTPGNWLAGSDCAAAECARRLPEAAVFHAPARQLRCDMVPRGVANGDACFTGRRSATTN